MTLFDYTDPQNHRFQVFDHRENTARRRVTIQATDMRIGGDWADVWMDVTELPLFISALRERAGYDYTDHMGDTLAVDQAEDWTTFTLTRAPRSDDEKPMTVKSVVLAARVRSLVSVLAAVDDQEQRSNPTETDEPDTTQDSAPPAPRVTITITPDADDPGQLDVTSEGHGIGYTALAYTLRAVAAEYDRKARAELGICGAELATGKPCARHRAERPVIMAPKRSGKTAEAISALLDFITTQLPNEPDEQPDEKPGLAGSACPLDVFLRTYERDQ
ncbi:hypothetical protein E4K10_18105 [Streptomyces sp. T1317-0309]|nr:hypothetical protein E4K10_18105 [Streptomyces sp. T1317-0309]